MKIRTWAAAWLLVSFGIKAWAGLVLFYFSATVCFAWELRQMMASSRGTVLDRCAEVLMGVGVLAGAIATFIEATKMWK